MSLPQLRILHLENDPVDSEAVRLFLQRDGLTALIDCVATLEGFQEAWMRQAYELILSDYMIPGLNTLELLQWVRQADPNVPFIFVSGTQGEELAVETLKMGATDYVLKQRIGRLAPSVRRALQEVEAQDRRRQAEKLLHQNEALYRQTFENAAVGMAHVALDGRWLSVNERLCQIVGYSREELLAGITFQELTYPEDLNADLSQLERLLAGQITTYSMEERYIHKDGHPVWINLTVSLQRDEAGRPLYCIVVIEDITLRKQAEQALRESEEHLRESEAKFRAVFEKSSIGKGRVGFSDARWTDVNDAFCRMLGYSREEMLSIPWPQMTHPEDVNLDLESFRRMAAGELDSYTVEKRFIHKQGRHVWARLTLTLVRDALGRPDYEIAVIEDITERKWAEDALRSMNEALASANQKLTEADRRKDEFLAMLAHELRNPLAPIRYAAQMLHLAGVGPEQIQKQRQVIDRQVSHMGRLLDDLLDISRITRGKITLKRETLDLRTVAEQAIESMRPMIDGRGQHFKYESVSSPLLVQGDPTRLEQIMRNILHNANKYTEAGGCIKMSLGLDCDDEHAWRAVVRVIDSGIGIAPEMLPHIFEAFVQAEPGLARSQGGLGIGLAMVRNLVKLHGGSVDAQSNGPGRGSVFTVRLPLAGIESIAPKSAKLVAGGRIPPSGLCRVLVVDDNEDSAASLSELLSLWGHEVRTAFDGSHALEAAREWRPEVILLDIGLPGMDGYQVAGRLRREPGNGPAYLVALTGYGAEEDRRRALDAGFDQHLTKPVELEQLQAILKNRCAA